MPSKMKILVITSYPEKECGIATFSNDLIHSLTDKFAASIEVVVCAIDHEKTLDNYPSPVAYVLNIADATSYTRLASEINADNSFDGVLIQHEFGLFSGEYGEHLIQLMAKIDIPIFTTFHTILPAPNSHRKKIVQLIAQFSKQLIVMSESSKVILANDYQIQHDLITIIPHGTHLLSLKNAVDLKEKTDLSGKLVLSTFGLLSSGKNIETALMALPELLKEFPNVVYLILGKTHPEVIRSEGERYRNKLETLCETLAISKNVRFINEFVTKNELENYLQLTDIYLFTSIDPNQAVSGTFAYAMACGCPIISTKIPQAKALLNNAGIVIDFGASDQLAEAAKKMFRDPVYLKQMKLNALQTIRPTAWQNVAINYMMVFRKGLAIEKTPLIYQIPAYQPAHIFNTTTAIGIIQFSTVESPSLLSGYTIDDNARALIAMLDYYELTADEAALKVIPIYFNFIVRMHQDNGRFLNYLDVNLKLTEQNYNENLEDANGRTIWALGTFMKNSHLYNFKYTFFIHQLIEKSIPYMEELISPRAIAFSIKGLYQFNSVVNDIKIKLLIEQLADKLVHCYAQNREEDWHWFEKTITYANSSIPEALLLAFIATRNERYASVAKESFDFLLALLFEKDHFRVISNRTWHSKNKVRSFYGEQPIDVAYTIIALQTFDNCFPNAGYIEKMTIAFDWYLGKNQLNQIVYNPISGGCYDGLEEKEVNINQGAEATTTYLMARNCMENHMRKITQLNLKKINHQYKQITHFENV